MRNMQRKLGVATGVAGVLLSMLAAGSAAAEAMRPAGNGLEEIPDDELGDMRGRYVVSDTAVAWFGVTMISTWQTASGQTLQGTLQLAMDFGKGGATPVVSFEPSVSITAAGDAASPAGTDGNRAIDGSGLANAGGLVQSVQIAGDGNRAGNTAYLTVRNGAVPATSAGAGGAMSAQDAAGSATAIAGFDGHSARLLLQVQGQGAVEQWIRSGSVGQSVMLTSDGQQVSNWLNVELVRQSVGDNAQLAQNVAQAIVFARGIGGHF